MRHVPILIVFSLVAACNRAPAAQSQTAAAQTAGSGAAQGATPAPQGATSPAAPGQAPAAKEPVKPVPATLPDVVARINGDACNRGELERALRNIEQRAGRPVPPERRDEVVRGVLDELLTFKLVQVEGKARGIVVTDQEIDSRIAEIRKQVPNDAAFQEALKQRQMTVADLRNETRTEILVNKTMEAEIAPKVVVSPADLEAYYKANPDQFKQPEQLRASHILFAVDSGATPDFKKTTRDQAEAVLKRARAGEDFAALAKQYSKDGSAQQGGDLNFFGRGQMVPQFDQAAFALKDGEISDIVETQFGFHIIKATERKPERIVPLAEVSDRLTGFLRQKKSQELVQQFVQSLKAKYKVEVLI